METTTRWSCVPRSIWLSPGAARSSGAMNRAACLALAARDLVDTLGSPEQGGLGLELLCRTPFLGHADRDHAAWIAMAVRIPPQGTAPQEPDFNPYASRRRNLKPSFHPRILATLHEPRVSRKRSVTHEMSPRCTPPRSVCTAIGSRRRPCSRGQRRCTCTRSPRLGLGSSCRIPQRCTTAADQTEIVQDTPASRSMRRRTSPRRRSSGSHSRGARCGCWRNRSWRYWACPSFPGCRPGAGGSRQREGRERSTEHAPEPR